MNSDSNEERIEQLEVALSSTPKAFMEGASPKRSSDDEEPEQANRSYAHSRLKARLK